MNYVHESLNMFQDDKFFKELNEGKESSEKRPVSNDKKEAAELEKQGMMVIKKITDNFNRFKAAAGDKVGPYAKFWGEQQEQARILKTEDLQGMLYKMYDSQYVVMLIKDQDGSAEMIVKNLQNHDNIFATKNKNVVKQFVKFHQLLKNTMKEIINNTKSRIEAKKAEETAQKKAEIAAAKKAKLDQFLKESLKESDHQENEGAHYKAQLEEIVEMAEELYSNLPEGDVPAWVGDKIVVAKEYLYAVKSWLHTGEEEKEGIEKGPNREMDSDEEHMEINMMPLHDESIMESKKKIKKLMSR